MDKSDFHENQTVYIEGDTRRHLLCRDVTPETVYKIGNKYVTTNFEGGSKYSIDNGKRRTSGFGYIPVSVMHLSVEEIFKGWIDEELCRKIKEEFRYDRVDADQIRKIAEILNIKPGEDVIKKIDEEKKRLERYGHQVD